MSECDNFVGLSVMSSNLKVSQSTCKSKQCETWEPLSLSSTCKAVQSDQTFCCQHEQFINSQVLSL